jgi:hypothetical protein
MAGDGGRSTRKTWALTLVVLVMGVLYFTSTWTAERFRKHATRDEQIENAHAAGKFFGTQSGLSSQHGDPMTKQQTAESTGSGGDKSVQSGENLQKPGTSEGRDSVGGLARNQNEVDSSDSSAKKQAEMVMANQLNMIKEADSEGSKTLREEKPSGQADTPGQDAKPSQADVQIAKQCDESTLRVVQMQYSGAIYKLSVHSGEEDSVISKTLLEGSGKYGSVTEVRFMLKNVLFACAFAYCFAACA